MRVTIVAVLAMLIPGPVMAQSATDPTVKGTPSGGSTVSCWFDDNAYSVGISAHLGQDVYRCYLDEKRQATWALIRNAPPGDCIFKGERYSLGSILSVDPTHSSICDKGVWTSQSVSAR
jgi:hypothetical protein